MYRDPAGGGGEERKEGKEKADLWSRFLLHRLLFSLAQPPSVTLLHLDWLVISLFQATAIAIPIIILFR